MQEKSECQLRRFIGYHAVGLAPYGTPRLAWIAPKPWAGEWLEIVFLVTGLIIHRLAETEHKELGVVGDRPPYLPWIGGGGGINA